MSVPILRKIPSQRCRCVSIKPGMTIMFEASIISASAALRFGPTAAILVSSINTSAWLKLPTFLSRLRTVPFLSNVRLAAIVASYYVWDRNECVTDCARLGKWAECVLKSFDIRSCLSNQLLFSEYVHLALSFRYKPACADSQIPQSCTPSIDSLTHVSIQPPSTLRLTPVTARFSSKKALASTTSSIVTNSPEGCGVDIYRAPPWAWPPSTGCPPRSRDGSHSRAKEHSRDRCPAGIQRIKKALVLLHQESLLK